VETGTLIVLTLFIVVGLTGLVFVVREFRAVVEQARVLQRSRAHLWSAIVLAALVATLGASVAVFVLRSMVLWFAAFTLGLVFLLPFFAAARLAKAMLGWVWLPAPRPRQLVAAVAVGLPIAIAGPWLVSWTLQGIDARRLVPPLPDARADRVEVTFGDGENHGDYVTLTFPATANRDSVLAFYRREYAARGFDAELPADSPRTTVSFCSDRRSIELRLGDPTAGGAVPYTATVERMGCPPPWGYALVTGRVRRTIGTVQGIQVLIHCNAPGVSFSEQGTTDSAGAFRIEFLELLQFVRTRGADYPIPCDIKASSTDGAATAPEVIRRDSVLFALSAARRPETVVELVLP
jgi:hypothetical protein